MCRRRTGGSARAFDDYFDVRARYHAAEARFAGAPFWERRRPIDWRSAPIELAPERMLAWVKAPSPRAEALLPPRAIAELERVLASPAMAHVVVSRVREIAPLGDRRLIVGLQLLLDEGALVAR